MTEPLDYQSWRRNRGTYIGGSDIAAILGVSPFRTVGEVWVEKVKAQEKLELGDETIDPEIENRFTRWGKLQEGIILQEYGAVTGYEVRAPGLHLWRHPDFPFIAGTIDGEATTDFKDLITVEVKTRDAFAEARAKRDGEIGTFWGEPGTDEVPRWYAVQVMQYMIVRAHLGYDTRADLVPLIGGNDFKIYQVQYDREFAEQMVELQIWFWGLVSRREAPPLDFAAKGATKLQRRIHDKIVGETVKVQKNHRLRADGPTVTQLFQIHYSAHVEKERQEAIEEAALAELTAIAGDSPRLEVEGTKLAINRKANPGHIVPGYVVPPFMAVKLEPYQYKARKKVLDAISEEDRDTEQREVEAGTNVLEGRAADDFG